jgi:hypothetical protein
MNPPPSGMNPPPSAIAVVPEDGQAEVFGLKWTHDDEGDPRPRPRRRLLEGVSYPSIPAWCKSRIYLTGAHLVQVLSAFPFLLEMRLVMMILSPFGQLGIWAPSHEGVCFHITLPSLRNRDVLVEGL